MGLPQILPPSTVEAPFKILSAAETAAHLGVSQRTLRRMVANDLFPKPVFFGHRSRGWFSFELSAVLDARIRGMDDDGVREVVARIIANRKAAPILSTPSPVLPPKAKAG